LLIACTEFYRLAVQPSLENAAMRPTMLKSNKLNGDHTLSPMDRTKAAEKRPERDFRLSTPNHGSRKEGELSEKSLVRARSTSQLAAAFAFSPSLPVPMTDTPRRPILRLKTAPGEPALESAASPATRWKCRPCGMVFDLPAEAEDADPVRCPKCNAKLGKAVDFRGDPPLLDKLRARPVAAKPPPPAAPPIIKARRKPIAPIQRG
jgi:DNA-directed RNA polymerase subunit RPC12/RpoP